MTDLQIPALAHGGPQDTITRIVLHGTVSPCIPGGARANGRWFASKRAGTSAHYVVDPTETVQCLPDDVIGFHAPPNTGSIGVELCDPESGPGARWQDAPHLAMLQRAAVLVADLCKRHNVPVTYVDAADLLAGKRGITRHADVSLAWHQSTHRDPIDFPLQAFLALVRQSSPTPTPIPEDDMTPEQAQQLAEVHAMLTDLGAKRRPDHADTDTQRISLGDVVTAVEKGPTRQ